MPTPQNAELLEKLEIIKRGIEEKVPEGAKFIFDCMDGGKVPSYHSRSNRFGLWPAAEMAHFLLTNHILPKTCSQKIEQIIDFLISNFDEKVGAWPATINGTQTYFSAHMTGYCTYVFKLYFNDFLIDERKIQIESIINQAEKYLISKQMEAGFWTPESTKGATPSPDGINYADFFYSYYAYFGIREVGGYHRNSNTDINNALDRAKKYFRKYAEILINQQIDETADQTERMSNVSKLLQVLNDFDDKSLSDDIDKLHSISLQIFDKVKDSFATSSVLLDRLDDSAQKTYNNNTPFDVYFALRSDKYSLDNLLQVVKWYLDHQDVSEHCWHLRADPMTNTNTWTTIEAMMVLSDAYDFIAEDFYLREMEHNSCSCKKSLRSKNNDYKDEVKKIKISSIILISIAVVVSLLISILCLVLFVKISANGLTAEILQWVDMMKGALYSNLILQFVLVLVQGAINYVRNFAKHKDNNSDNK